jgi:hypothetical protein
LFLKNKTIPFFEIADYDNGRAYNSEKFSEDFIEGGIRISKIGDVTKKRTNENWTFVDNSEFVKQNGKYLINNDILMSLTGDPPDVGKVNLFKSNSIKSTWNQRVARVFLKVDQSAYLNNQIFFAVLSNKYCRQQLERYAKGIRQRNLGTECLEKLRLPILSSNFQLLLDGLITISFDNLQKSQKSYAEADSLLLEKLNFRDYNPDAKAINVKLFTESFVQTGRLDAEYYQPKFDDLKKRITATGHAIKLGNHLSMNKRGTQPIYTDSQLGLRVLNSKHIRENRIDFSDTRLGISGNPTAELVIKKNDVLINGTGVGTIGRSAVYMRNEPALPDNHVTILRTNDIDPVFLSVQLNSIIGKLQVEKYFKGSSGQIELYPGDIDEFIIWKAPPEVQSQIRKTIEESEKLRLESEKLLKIAKNAVEIAIEEGEEKAMAYINLNT